MNGTAVAETMDFVFGTVELASVLVGLTLNVMTIPYFYRNREQFSSLVYLLIVVTDILSLLSCFPSAISM